MKKIIAMFVLAIFVLGMIPIAFAETDEGYDVEIQDKGPKENKGLMKAAGKVVEQAKDKLKLNRERYETLKQKHLEVKEMLKEKRTKLAELQERAKKCKENPEECKVAKNEIKIVAKDKLEQTIELIQRSLEKLVNRVKDSEKLTDEEKQEAVDQINELQDKLNAKIDEVKALDPTSEDYRVEFRNKVKELKSLWNEVTKKQKLILTHLVNNKMENIVDKHEEYYNAMMMRIENLKDASEEDISALKEKADEFRSAVDVLNKEYQEAQDAWKVAKTENTKETLESAKVEQDDVRKQMKVTKELLREFVKDFNEVYKNNKVFEGAEETEDEE